MAELLTDEQIDEFKEVFKLIDKDRAGYITSKAIGNFLRFVGENPTNAHVRKIIYEVDIYGTGVISFPDFLKLMAPKERAVTYSEDELKEAFEVFDRDGDGFICAEEFHRVLADFGEDLTAEEAAEMIKQVDIDGDGKLNYDQFARIMCAE